MTETLEKWYTVEEIAEALQVQPRTIRVWLRDGRLEGSKAGRGWRVRQAALDAFLSRPR